MALGKEDSHLSHYEMDDNIPGDIQSYHKCMEPWKEAEDYY